MMYLLLGVHNHQPVGNFGHVLEKAFRSSYEPFLAVLERHPKIRMAMHHSGILFDWFEKTHPDYLDRINTLVRKGQIELLCGGYYEPVLSTLPEKDQRGQVGKMQKYLKGRFGSPAEGLWLTERVWEPHLPKALEKTGVRYTIADDAHFMAVGFSTKELQGYFLTEAEGADLRIFPISQRLRYMIPFAPPREVIDFLKRTHDEMGGGSGALVMADDGEKFGLWPKTHQTVYEEGWLENFFTEVERNESWLRCATFSEYLNIASPRGWAYLPTMSYSELSEWALRPDSSRELESILKGANERTKVFVRGGYFRNFLTKYPEANSLYRKMLRVSRKVHGLDAKAPEKENALDHLWKGQCNCAYWHGVFGGLYLPHLRGAIYSELIAAEKIADEVSLKAGGQERAHKADNYFPAGAGHFWIHQEDWDADGKSELLVESPQANWYFAPARGAGLWEWDLKTRRINLNSIVNRRPEAYHEKIKEAVLAEAGSSGVGHGPASAKEPGLEKHLIYDWHQRMSLLDHFLHPDTTPEQFASAKYGEQGDFVLEPYEQKSASVVGDRFCVEFERCGRVWAHNIPIKVRVRKKVFLQPSGAWSCRYRIDNISAEQAELWFGSELVLAFSTPDVCGLLGERSIREKAFHDPAFGLDVVFRSEAPMGLWAFPINTISQSEEGFEKTYQGSVLLAHQKLDLAPGGSVEFEFGLTV